MLLISLKLKNFRQYYGDQKIDFATDKDANVTFILGRGGAGKTTISQAIQWCLYGNTDFQEKTLLSVKKAQQMKNDEQEKAVVTIELEHNEKNYIITRYQIFKKNNDKVAAIGKSSLEIKEINEKGRQVEIKDEDCSHVVNSILPENLARYFLFDGEKIEKMVLELKSSVIKEFKKAVEKILGLEALKNMKDHFTPTEATTTKSIFSEFNKITSSSGVKQADDLSKEIISLSNSITDLENENVKSNDEIISMKEKLKDIIDKLTNEKESASLQKEESSLKRKIDLLESGIVHQQLQIANTFSKRINDYLIKYPLGIILNEIKDFDILQAGIPDITSDTIHFILRDGTCICGATVKKPEEQKKLIKLLDLLPPQSISTYLGNYINDAESKLKNSTDYYDNYIKEYKFLREKIKEKDDAEIELKKIELRLNKIDSKAIGEAQELKKILDDAIKSKSDSVNKNLGKIDLIIEQVNKLKTQLSNLKGISLSLDLNNKYKVLAEQVFNKINSIYSAEETKTLTKLNEIINRVFSQIYSDGTTIKITENYKITLSINEVKDENLNQLQANTSKQYSVIFSFIVALIEMAKLKRVNNGIQLSHDNQMYPMIMDAPLSAFDRERIKRITDILPKSADQIMMFIKDTDGLEAKKYLSNFIGAEYVINQEKTPNGKASEIHSVIERVK